jgi:tetratricopeptide (TPR) repeat protein
MNSRHLQDKQRIRELVDTANLPEAMKLCARLCEREPRDAEAWFLRGAIHGHRGEFAESVTCLRRTIALQPHAAIAHYNLGLALFHLGDYAASAVSLQEAARFNPASAETLHDLGNVYQASGRTDEAVASYQKALAIQPGFATAHYNLAQALLKQNRIPEATDHLLFFLAQNLSHVEARLLGADLLYQQGRLKESAEHYREILRLRPEHAAAHVNLGNILSKLGDLDGAITQYQAAIACQNDCTDAYYNLGNACLAREQFDDARRHYETTLSLNPDHHLAWNNLGLAHQQQGRADEALRCFRRALDIRPDGIEPWLNIASQARDEMRLDDALAALDKAVELQPDAPGPHRERGILRLFMGDFEQGWNEYEWRWQGGEGMIPRAFSYPPWQGESLSDKTIFVHAEQGIGDEIMFASCFPDLIARAGQVVIGCAPRLAPLFRRSFPDATICGGAQNEDLARIAGLESVDVQVPAGSLPRYFRRTLGDFPARSHYLVADATRIQEWRARFMLLGAGLKVGISWRGGHLPRIARRRSTTLDQWAPTLLAVPGIQWISLQYGLRDDELEKAREQTGVTIHHWPDADPLKELDDFAAQVAAVDLAISVDNATVHMAGALGVETWVLQPFSPDWRWIAGRDDSPWYASLKQFRQPQASDWISVFENAGVALRRRLG